jgi:hypothetical protein
MSEYMRHFYEHTDEEALRVMKANPEDSCYRVFKELLGMLGDETKAIQAFKAENLFVTRRGSEVFGGREYATWIRRYLVDRNLAWDQENLDLAVEEYKVAHKC